MININDPYYLPNFDEASCSQIPAIIQLINLGYNYIGRHEVDQYRESKSQYILRDIAFKAIRDINGANISDKSILNSCQSGTPPQTHPQSQSPQTSPEAYVPSPCR